MADFVGLVLLHTAKGRDKFCAFAQNFAKFYSLQHGIGSENHAVYRAMENNISDGRKIFKWFKFFPEGTRASWCVRARVRGVQREDASSAAPGEHAHAAPAEPCCPLPLGPLALRGARALHERCATRGSSSCGPGAHPLSSL